MAERGRQGIPTTSRGRHALTRDGRPIVPAPPRIDRTSSGTAHLPRLAREHGHQIGGMTPMALDAGQPPDYGLAIEMLIHNDNLRQASAGPSVGWPKVADPTS